MQCCRPVEVGVAVDGFILEVGVGEGEGVGKGGSQSPARYPICSEADNAKVFPLINAVLR